MPAPINRQRIRIFVASPGDGSEERHSPDRADSSHPVPCRHRPRLGRTTALWLQGDRL
jgi:hypothetical protein